MSNGHVFVANWISFCFGVWISEWYVLSTRLQENFSGTANSCLWPGN